LPELGARRVTLVADSHGRHLSRLLRERLSDRQITGNIHPGAPFSRVVDSAFSLCVNERYTRDDCIIVLGGTNSFVDTSTELDVSIFISSMRTLISECGSTNLIFSTIPYRYDLSESSRVNVLVRKTNSMIRSVCLENSIPLIETWNFKRNLHTRHGLHLNMFGKKQVTSIICDILKSKFNQSETPDEAGDESYRRGLDDYERRVPVPINHQKKNRWSTVAFRIT
jgi:hypothetical protein